MVRTARHARRGEADPEVTYDGTAALFRHRGGLVDAATLDALRSSHLRSPASLSIDERIYQLGEALSLEDDALASSVSKLALRMGVPETVYRESAAAGAVSTAQGDWEE